IPMAYYLLVDGVRWAYARRAGTIWRESRIALGSAIRVARDDRLSDLQTSRSVKYSASEVWISSAWIMSPVVRNGAPADPPVVCGAHRLEPPAAGLCAVSAPRAFGHFKVTATRNPSAPDGGVARDGGSVQPRPSTGVDVEAPTRKLSPSAVAVVEVELLLM